jgi:hypothetical protein
MIRHLLAALCGVLADAAVASAETMRSRYTLPDLRRCRRSSA